MSSTPLHAAATALSLLLSSYNIQHAIFGGLALLLNAKYEYRNTKDVDVLTTASKSTILSILSHFPEIWIPIPQAREDYVAFFYRHHRPGTPLVLVEFFTSSPLKAFPSTRTIAGLPVLTPSALFKGKIAACANRSKTSDMFDVLFLCTNFPEEVRTAKGVEGILQAIRRWPQLRLVLERAGVRVRERRWGRNIVVDGKIPVGGVQKALGCAW